MIQYYRAKAVLALYRFSGLCSSACKFQLLIMHCAKKGQLRNHETSTTPTQTLPVPDGKSMNPARSSLTRTSRTRIPRPTSRRGNATITNICPSNPITPSRRPTNARIRMAFQTERHACQKRNLHHAADSEVICTIHHQIINHGRFIGAWCTPCDRTGFIGSVHAYGRPVVEADFGALRGCAARACVGLEGGVD